MSTSSTEAEFIAAISAGKMDKHFHYVLEELGVVQHGPTEIYEDNVDAILMENEGKPTERSFHVDIQYFALQEWVERKIVKLSHIPGIANKADFFTEELGWVLHFHHITTLMGHCGSSYTNTYGLILKV